MSWRFCASGLHDLLLEGWKDRYVLFPSVREGCFMICGGPMGELE